MFSTSILAIGAAALLGATASAATISGAIEFVGSNATFNSSGPDLTGVQSWGNVTVIGAVGDFTGTSGSVALATPWSFNSGAVADFWNVGGFSFHLTSSMINFQDANVVNVIGNGIVVGNSFEPTYGSWEFSKNKNSQIFSFLGGTVAEGEAVPDGGTTLALFGVSLLGIYGARRKFRDARA